MNKLHSNGKISEIIEDAKWNLWLSTIDGYYEGDLEDIRTLKTKTKPQFEQAIHYYFDSEFGKTADISKVIAAKFPEDIATEYYLTKAVKYVFDGVDVDWNDVEKMVSK